MGNPASVLLVPSHPDSEAMAMWLFRNLRSLCEQIGASCPSPDTTEAMLSGMFIADRFLGTIIPSDTGKESSLYNPVGLV
jgi:hypothetical protein